MAMKRRDDDAAGNLQIFEIYTRRSDQLIIKTAGAVKCARFTESLFKSPSMFVFNMRDSIDPCGKVKLRWPIVFASFNKVDTKTEIYSVLFIGFI
jgi:hypothetical protein